MRKSVVLFISFVLSTFAFTAFAEYVDDAKYYSVRCNKGYKLKKSKSGYTCYKPAKTKYYEGKCKGATYKHEKNVNGRWICCKTTNDSRCDSDKKPVCKNGKRNHKSKKRGRMCKKYISAKYLKPMFK